MRSRWHWWGRAVAVGAVLATVLAGCGSQSAEYVVNQQAQLYFKVPNNWSLRAIDGESLGASSFLRDGTWARLFTPADFDVEKVTLATAPGPIGTVLIGQLEQGAFDSLNLQSLRSVAYTDSSGQTVAVDPVELINSQDDDIAHLGLYQEIERNGIRGFHLRYIMQPDPTQPAVVYDESKYVYDAQHLFYWFRIACSVDCYVSNRQQINSIVNSLRVRKDQP